MRNLIILTGQTATGKSRHALDLAKKINGQLINCDSRQIYKKLDIVTGKDIGYHKFFEVTSFSNFSVGYYLIDNIKVWLYDVIDPKVFFSSYDYTTIAQYVIKRITSKGKTPIIVGGTYLYIKHLLYGFETESIPPDWKLRKKLERKTVSELQEVLNDKSPTMFEKLNKSDQKNPQRLIRKIEIASHLRKVSAPTHRKSGSLLDADIEIIGFRYKKKQKLMSAVKKRVMERLKQGAVNEAKNLLKQGYSDSDPGLVTIGYKQIFQHLKGLLSKDEMINQWITKEVQYAKRQYTFMKKDSNIKWKAI